MCCSPGWLIRFASICGECFGSTRRYLELTGSAHSGRDDTIRSIVSRLMAVEEESENALAEEFAATATADGRPVHTVQDASRDEAENYNDPKWVPDPVDAPVGELCGTSPTAR